MVNFFDNCNEDANVIKYKGFRFTKDVVRKDIGVSLKIYGHYLKSNEKQLIYSVLIDDENYLYELEEVIRNHLNDWIINNTSEQDRIFVTLKNWYLLH